MKIKTIIAVLLIVTMIATLCACNDKSNTTDAPSVDSGSVIIPEVDDTTGDTSDTTEQKPSDTTDGNEETTPDTNPEDAVDVYGQDYANKLVSFTKATPSEVYADYVSERTTLYKNECNNVLIMDTRDEKIELTITCELTEATVNGETVKGYRIKIVDANQEVITSFFFNLVGIVRIDMDERGANINFEPNFEDVSFYVLTD